MIRSYIYVLGWILVLVIYFILCSDWDKSCCILQMACEISMFALSSHLRRHGLLNVLPYDCFVSFQKREKKGGVF